MVLEYFENEPTDVLATAYMYARNMKNYGIDITKDLDTATYYIKHLLHQAYTKGVADEQAKWKLRMLECGRDFVKEFGKCPMCTDCPDGCPLAIKE